MSALIPGHRDEGAHPRARAADTTSGSRPPGASGGVMPWGLMRCCADDTGRGTQGLTIRLPRTVGQRLAVGCDRARDRGSDRGRSSSRFADRVCDITVVSVAAEHLRGCGLPCLVGGGVRESRETLALPLLHSRGSAVTSTWFNLRQYPVPVHARHWDLRSSTEALSLPHKRARLSHVRALKCPVLILRARPNACNDPEARGLQVPLPQSNLTRSSSDR